MKRHLGLAGATVAIVAGVVAYAQMARSDSTPAPITAPVTRGSIVETVEATGTIQPVTTVQVGTQVSGTIKSLAADFNTTVTRGQVIAVLEPSLFQTQVEQAKATVARLQADAERAAVEVSDTQAKLRRAQELSAQQLISRSDLETAVAAANQAQAQVKSAQAQIVQARAQLEQAQVNLGHTVITAPIDGVVVARSVDVGQTVAASMQAPTLFVIAGDLSQMQVLASVDESDIGRVRQGQPVSFTVDAYPGETFTGTVSQVRLQPTVDQNVVSYTTVIDVPNRSQKLKPGMTASVSIEIARADDVLRVPASALRFRASQERAQDPAPRVWVWENGAMQPRRVEVGLSNGATTAITGGDLREGADVVTGTADAGQRASSPSTTSPLLPFGNRRGAGGGRPGSGGAR
jgi:HlyD family secretion protein